MHTRQKRHGRKTMPQEALDDVNRLCEAYLPLLFAPEVALDVEEPLGREIVREFLGYDRTEYLRRKIGEAEDANHVWSVHLQPLRKLLHVGERPAFEKPCPFPCAGEQSYERPRFVKVDVVHLALPDDDEPPASADGLKLVDEKLIASIRL